MATTRIKDVSKTTTDLASDEYIVADGATNGTQKMARDDAYADWAAAYVAAPTTYKLAPLNSGTNKIDGTYLPTSADTAKGEWNANANTPSLADGAGTAGDYYDVTTAGSVDLGSGSITYTVGDVVKYNGTTWYKIDSVANVLDGSATAAAGRTTLEVNSVDEDAEATGTKLVSPSLYFDGTNDYLEIADSDKLSFTSTSDLGDSSGVWTATTNSPAITDGTGTLNDNYKITTTGTVAQGASTLSIINGVSATAGQVVYYDGAVWRLKDSDDLPFSISAFVRLDTLTDGGILSKFGVGATAREWRFKWTSNDCILIECRDLSGNYIGRNSTVTGLQGKWTHVAVTYNGGGAYTDFELYVNGVNSSGSSADSGSYANMSNTSEPVLIGSRSVADFFDGHIKEVKLFNRELTAAEVVDSMNGDLGFADEWGGAFGGVYTSDFSAGVDGATATRGTVAGNIDSIGGQDDNLRFTCTDATNNTHYISKNSIFTSGKRTRLEFDYYAASTNSDLVGLQIGTDADLDLIAPRFNMVQDAWTRVSYEFIPDSANLRLFTASSSSITYQDAGGDDVFYIRNVTVTEIGTLADLRASNFDESTDKLYDESSNAFIATNNGSTLVGRALPVYQTGTWTPALTFGGGSTGMTYTSQEGFYTRIGNTVFATGGLILSAVGSSTGAAAIALPYTARNTTDDIQGVSVGRALNMVGLTSAVSGYVIDNTTSCRLVDWGSTGSVDLDEGNFGATAEINISVTYQIS